jgi:1-acyl-sn-glycerol-3-phosphate acyltransferase
VPNEVYVKHAGPLPPRFRSMTEKQTATPHRQDLPDIAELLTIVSRLVGEVHPKWKHIRFTPDTLLERELGLDSMARMELRMRIDREMGVELDEQAAMRATTPHELLCAIHASLTGQNPDKLQQMAASDENPADLLLGEFSCDELPHAGRHAHHSIADWLYAIYCWPVFIVLAIISWFVVVLTPGRDLRQKLGRGLARLLFRATFIPLTVNGREHIKRERPLVIVANHASYLDGFIVTAALDIPVHFIVKGELSRILIVRLILQRFGVEFVDRFNAQRGASSVRRIARKSKKGHSLVFFPEGTFISFAGLQPFRMGAFVTAARSNTPVLPLAIEGARNIVRGDHWFPRPGRIKVTICPTVEPEGSSWQDALKLRDAARREISAWCGEPDMIELYGHSTAEDASAQGVEQQPAG